jgi:dihydroneopterin aldolase
VTDRILLKDLAFFGYHGVKPEEKALGQRFLVDLELRLDLGPAGRADDLALTIDYGQVFGVVRELLEGPGRDTLEAVAEAVAAALFGRFPRLEAVVVQVKKPGAPIPSAQSGTVSVEISRQRQTGGG